ncbi:MAG TPA: MFS transporter [Burkholderiales bacterium]|nr:MFS transporter [Burkholderiales bacterium]
MGTDQPSPKRGLSPVYARDPQVDRSLRYSVRDGVAWSLMFGAGESYLQAFAVFLKATTAQITLLTAVPLLLGSVAQLASAWVAGQAIRRKALIFAGVALQSLAWLPIIALAFIPLEASIALLIAAVTLYYIGGQFAAPPWSSLISDLVPERRRGRFFGRRTQLMSIMTFASLTVAGLALELSEQRALAHWGFAGIFGIALVARLYSLEQLMRMHEPLARLAPLTLPPLERLLERVHGSDFGRFALFVAFMNLAVAIASPFFTLYMLRDLDFSYLEFTAATAFGVLMQFAALNLWGRLSDVFGNLRVVQVTSIVFPALPVLWVLFPNFWAILVFQFIGGIVWAGFSLAAGNFLYDVALPEKRAAYSAVHQALSNTAVFAGALLGGFLATHAPRELQIGGYTFVFASGLWLALCASSVARAVVIAVFLRGLRETRLVRPISPTALAIRVIRANVLAEWLFELLPGRKRPPKDRPPPPEKPL